MTGYTLEFDVSVSETNASIIIKHLYNLPRSTRNYLIRIQLNLKNI